MPYEEETIQLCQWLLNIEEKHQNWALVSEIQIKIATIYSQLNKKEKAIGLVSSAIKLNNDIKNFSSRYRHLITIALLLLDLNDYERLRKLLANTNFDMSLLNKEDMAKLWLIDGHMLFHANRYGEAESSFNKVFEQIELNLPNALLAKTHLLLVKIHEMFAMLYLKK